MLNFKNPLSLTHHQFNAILIAFFSTMLFLLLTIFLLYTLYPKYGLPVPQIPSLFMGGAHPKPLEKEIGIAVLIMLPIFSLLCIKIAASTIIEENIRKSGFFWSILFSFSVPFFVFLAFYKSDFISLTCRNIIFSNHKFHSSLALIISLILSGVCMYYSLSLKKNLYPRKKFIWFVVIAAIVFQTISFRISNIYSVDNTWPWTADFDTVYYPLSQVIMGKTLLVNLTSQYGLYPEFLNIIFKIIGLHVFTFTLIMALMQCAALLFLTDFLFNIIKNSWLIVLYILSACLITGSTWMFVNLHSWEPYYQYYPIRFFFPAVAIYCFWRFVKNPIFKNIVIMSALGAIATLWNLDTGIPVLGAFWAYLLMRLMFFPAGIERKVRLRNIVISCCIALVTWILFFLYLYIKSGQPLNLYGVIKYQEIFEITGLGMLPMPVKYHPWMIFYATYIFSIVATFYAWLKNSKSYFWDMIFYLSILGIGLFTYYQGRSHEYNLVNICWLPLLLGIILSDRLLRLVRAKKLMKQNILFIVPVIFLITLLTLNFAITTPKLFRYGKNSWSIMLQKKPTAILDNIAFIKEHTNHAQKTVILSQNQGIYYTETHLVSAINVPNIMSILLQSDYNKMINQLLMMPIDNLFIEADVHNKIPPQYKALLTKFHIKQESKANMFYLTYDN